jgi:hypothetical protein
MTSRYFYAKIASIMLVITERRVLKRVAKKRYSDIEVNPIFSGVIGDTTAFRKARGIEKTIFLDETVKNDRLTIRLVKYHLYWLYKFHPYRGGKAVAVINDILENAVERKLLYPFDHSTDENDTNERLRLTKEGARYISRFYYLRAFYNNRHVQLTITTLIQWGIPIVALWALSRFFNVDISNR